METQVLYKAYRIYRGVKELIGSYQKAEDAHDAAQRYNTPQTIIQIEKTSQFNENI